MLLRADFWNKPIFKDQMNTDNVLMHNTDVERDGANRRRTERWILQSGLFLSANRERGQWRGWLSADEVTWQE